MLLLGFELLHFLINQSITFWSLEGKLEDPESRYLGAKAFGQLGILPTPITLCDPGELGYQLNLGTI
jgi:hypothetical protein